MKINPGKTIDELIVAISFVTDLEGDKKIYHAWRVAIIATKLAGLKVKSHKRKDIFYACLLHDIGGVGLPHHIIHYLQRRDKTSHSILLSHPIIGAQLIWSIPNMDSPSKFILDHHEWFNGEGYPRGKMTREIPLGAQIIRVADFIDINFQQSHRQKLNKISQCIDQASGKEFSRELAKSANNILKRKKFFNQITKRKNIPRLFSKTKGTLPGLDIKKGVDAVGMALETFAQVIDMKHPFTAGHSLRVSRFAMAIGLAMNLAHDEITKLKWAGLIHDIGKLTVSRKILDKPTKLTKKEFKEVMKHAEMTRKIMQMISTFKNITPAASSHHEYFNGSGYPKGLKEYRIPLGSRILCVCDAFDAMTSNRPYRAPLNPQAACREIQRFSGTQFDPQIVKEAIPILKSLSV